MLRKKIWNIAKSTALILIMLIVGEMVVKYFTTPTSNPVIPTMEDRVRMEHTVDTAFVGASSFSDGIIPDVYDEVRGTTSFNYASTAQTIVFSYYQVKDFFKYCSPKYVFIEISYSRLTIGNDGAEAIVRLDRIRSSDVRSELFRSLYGFDDIPKLVFPSARYGLSYIASVPQLKLTPKYLKAYIRDGYVFTSPKRFVYGGRGYTQWMTHAQPEDLEFQLKDYDTVLAGFDTETCKENVELLYKIDALCRENGAIPVWVTMPVTQESVGSFGEAYPKVVEFFREKAAADGVAYLNLHDDPKVWKILSTDSFKDSVHLNLEGATAFTRYFAGLDEENFVLR